MEASGAHKDGDLCRASDLEMKAGTSTGPNVQEACQMEAQQDGTRVAMY
jgi:hypothetical protein